MRRRHRVVSQPAAAINITSLLDITFVLLISFMVVAPNLRNGVQLELPEVTQAPVLAEEQKPLAISVRPGSGAPEIYFDGQVVQLDNLVAAIKAQSKENQVRPVTLEGDKSANWQEMAEVIATLRAGGITQIGIVTTVRKG